MTACSYWPICMLTICALIYMGLNMKEQVPVLTISIIHSKLAVNDNERADTKTCKHRTVDFFS